MTQIAAERKSRIPGPAAALLAAVVYTAGMAVNWMVTEESYATETASLVRSSIPVLSMLVVAMFVLAHWLRIRVVGDLRSRAWWVWPPVVAICLLPLATTIFLATNAGATDWGLVLGVLVGTLLVGFGEETAYRGIALQGLAQRFSIPVAVILQAILFGLLHAVNGLAGATGVPAQVIQTMIPGLAFGWVYVFSGGNLVLVAVLHGLYDWGLIAAGIPEAPTNGVLSAVAGIGVMVWFIFGLAMTVIGLFAYRGRRLSQL